MAEVRGGRRSHGDAETGAVLLAVLLLALLALAIGTTVALVADTETVIAASDREARLGRRTSESVAAFVVDELARQVDWTPALRGSVHSALNGPLTFPPAAGGGTVPLGVLTAELQQATYAGAAWAANTPRWQAFAFGAPARDLPVLRLSPLTFVVAWIADDVGEMDGDPTADSNGKVIIRVRAMTPGEGRGDVHAVVRRVAPGVVGVSSWRVLP